MIDQRIITTMMSCSESSPLRPMQAKVLISVKMMIKEGTHDRLVAKLEKDVKVEAIFT